MNNNYDDDIRMLMRRDSVTEQLAAFLFAAVFGIVSGAAALKIRETVLSIARRIIYTAELEVNQYRGIMQMWEIGTITVLVAAWLVTVLAAWHCIGRKADTTHRLRTCGIWCLFAAAVYGAAYVTGMIW
ncbi:MAG: hypothetical protein IJC56_01160 [Clostridia bacterium]|nr:hypothetical protein [Clostridia bacterium]